jgi:hypothetical protein
MMKFYAMVMSAWRGTDNKPQIYLTPGIVLATGDDDARRRGFVAAREAFPETEGWTGHQIGATEIPTPLELEGYCLTWQIEEACSTT